MNPFGSARLPGPRGLPWVGSWPAWRRDPFRFYPELGRRYGPLVQFRLGRHPIHLLNDPAGIEQVLMNDVERFRKGAGNEELTPLIGAGLFLAEGERWERSRRLVQPLFTRRNLNRIQTHVVNKTDEMLSGWERACLSGSSIEVHGQLRELTLRITALGLVGSDLFEHQPQLREVLDRLWLHTNRQIFRGLPWPAPLRARELARFEADRVRMEQALSKLLATRRRARVPQVVSEEPEDLLGWLLAARSRHDGGGLEDAAIRDELMTFLLAGQECTAIAIAWTLHLLATHPREQDELRRELLPVCGSNELELESIASSKRLRWVLDEAMRLYPPAWLMSRQCNQEEVLCGYTLPPDSVIQISPWVLHRDPRYWEQPLHFLPERFGPDRRARTPFTYLPFSAGPRACVGRPLALMLAQHILARIVIRFHLRRVEGPEPLPAAQLTLRPRHGIHLGLDRLSPS